ncbi:MAG: hypothetical protein II978_02055 [Clostridia bacterium]|nr:hypothetical protein [Clostridia bacterium]
MKKLIMLIMTALLVCALVCGCGKENGDITNGGTEIESQENIKPSDDKIKSSIVGAWMGEEDGQKLGYIFNEDGTGHAAIFPMTYTVENGVITVTVEAFGKKETGSACYNVNDDALTIETDDGTYVLHRTEMPK